MDSIFNLEKIFPTEESRFEAYKKWIVISAIFGPIAWLSEKALVAMIRVAERSYQVSSTFETWLNFLSILSIAGLIFSVVSIYIGFYIAWKSNVIKSFFKMLLGIFIGFFIMFTLLSIFPLLSFIVPVIGLASNWDRFKRYWESNDRFVKDNFKLAGMGFLALVCLLIGGLASFATSRYQFNAAPLVLGLLAAIGLWFVFPPIYIINVFNREKELGNTFYKSFYQFNMTGIFIAFSILALTASIHHNLFDGNGIVDDLTGNFSDSTMTGSEHIYSATPDMTTTHIADISDMHSEMPGDASFDMGGINSDPVGYMHPADLNHSSVGVDSYVQNPDMSSLDAHTNLHDISHNMNMHTDGLNGDFGPDLMGGNFMDVFGGTNIPDIPQMQQHPYMIFNDPSIHGNFQICDPNGMPQMTISNGTIVNSEYAVIGHVNTDAVSGVTTFTDINNNPLYSVDSHGQMFSGDCYIGHTSTSGNVTEIRDIHQHIVAVQDKLTGTWRTPDGKILSQIKEM